MSLISKQFGDIISKHGARYMLVASGVNSNRLRTPTWRKISPGDERELPTSLMKFGRKFNYQSTLGTQNMAVCDQLDCGQVVPGFRELRIQTVLPMTSSDNPNTGLVTVGFSILGLPDTRSVAAYGRSARSNSHDVLLAAPPVFSTDNNDGTDRVKTLSWSITGLPELGSRRRMRVSLNRQERSFKWVLPLMQGLDPITVVEDPDATHVSFDITSLPYA